MKTLRWLLPTALVAAFVLVPWAVWRSRPERPLTIVVVDKTVPFRTWLEHRSLFWLFDYLKVVKRDGSSYDVTRDYLGAYPPARAGDPPEHTRDLAPSDLSGADLLYVADTYGVYRDDLKSEARMVAALERSPKVYGGLGPDEAAAAAAWARDGGTWIAEFNSVGSPTEAPARETVETTMGFRWTRWIGRYFSDLASRDEVPEWMRRNWKRLHESDWTFEGAGYVLCRDDSAIEVLRVGPESKDIGLRLDRTRPADALLAGCSDGVPYPYWFDVVVPDKDAEVLAWFRWDLTDAGAAILKANGLPERFPAITRRVYPSGGRTFYFSGDFADNPLEQARLPFAGYLAFRRWLEGGKLAPSENAFFWRFYAPMVERMVSDLERRRR